MSTPVRVGVSPSSWTSRLAMPKSSSFTRWRPWGPGTRKTLAGLRSRWTMPRACGGPERVTHLGEQLHGQRRLQRPAREGGEALALQVLHDEVGAALARVEVVHGDDVLVLHEAHRARLGEEAGDELRLIGEVAVEHLHRDALGDEDVLGEQHRAHAAAAQLAQGHEAAEALAHEPLGPLARGRQGHRARRAGLGGPHDGGALRQLRVRSVAGAVRGGVGFHGTVESCQLRAAAADEGSHTWCVAKWLKCPACRPLSERIPSFPGTGERSRG